MRVPKYVEAFATYADDRTRTSTIRATITSNPGTPLRYEIHNIFPVTTAHSISP
jgi:hypothetical protein